jgi:tetratricopeptide (TPR) repeat protein
MGLLKIFSGKKPEEFEQKGDSLFELKDYGTAKIEYETALKKLEKMSPDNDELRDRIQQKLIQARDKLAMIHQQAGKELMDVQQYDEAEEKFRLALELAEDPELVVEIEDQLRQIDNRLTEDMEEEFGELDLRRGDADDPDYQERVDEYFTVLCESLPENLMEAYPGYGDNFRIGYVALNHGDFEFALTKLEQAMKENPCPSFIPLEVAKAYLNMDQYEATIPLLEVLLKVHPDLVQGYQLLCEAYWGMEKFDLARQALSSCPAELAASLPVYLLQGETLYRAQRYPEAESFYIECLKSFGWDEHIARALAVTYEAMGEKEKARDLYGEIMDECRGCGVRADPFVKQRFADLLFDSGGTSTKLLELYLSLVHEDPANRIHYYQKISKIYSEWGNDNEARRYQLFAKRLQAEADGGVEGTEEVEEVEEVEAVEGTGEVEEVEAVEAVEGTGESAGTGDIEGIREAEEA